MMAPLATLFLAALALQGAGGAGQQPARTRQAPRTGEVTSAADIAALRQAIDTLSREVALLRRQLADQQANDLRRFNANVARLQLVVTDLERMRNDRTDLLARQRQAEARADDARDRLANIQRELSFSNDLDRSAAEDRLRTTFNRQLDQATRDVADAEQQLNALDAKIDRFERMADTLRRRLKIDESQIDVEEETPPPAEPAPEPVTP